MRLPILVLLIAGAAGTAAAQAALPTGWRRLDDPVPAGQARRDSLPSFVRMPPGFHITTGGHGTIYYDAEAQASGRYVVESSGFLFPGTSTSGYGLFLGGAALDTPARATWTAFLLRRNGDLAVEMRKGGATTRIVAWTPITGVRTSSDSAVNNALRVVVAQDSVTVLVNGARALSIPRAGLPLDGTFGFRAGSDLNLHITTLDHTRHLAPVPAPRMP